MQKYALIELELKITSSFFSIRIEAEVDHCTVNANTYLKARDRTQANAQANQLHASEPSVLMRSGKRPVSLS